MKNKYAEKYKDHTVLSQDILSEEKEIGFFIDIRERLRMVRKELGLTQREFGESAGIDRRYIAKVECGSQRPSFKLLRNVSIKHKISLDWVLYGVGMPFIVSGEEHYGEELQLFKKLLDTGSQDDIDVVVKMIKKIV